MNGPGTRAVLFVSGCEHRCRGCYNEGTWSVDDGYLFDQAMQDRVIQDLSDTRINRRGLTLTGGDPFLFSNAIELVPFVERVRAECPSKDIWAWTGYRLPKMRQSPVQRDLLALIDVLVDGPYVERLKDRNLRWRGSSNQQIHVLTR